MLVWMFHISEGVLHVRSLVPVHRNRRQVSLVREMLPQKSWFANLLTIMDYNIMPVLDYRNGCGLVSGTCTQLRMVLTTCEWNSPFCNIACSMADDRLPLLLTFDEMAKSGSSASNRTLSSHSVTIDRPSWVSSRVSDIIACDWRMGWNNRTLIKLFECETENL